MEAILLPILNTVIAPMMSTVLPAVGGWATTVTPALTAAGVTSAMGIGGTLLSAAGTFAQGQAMATAARYNADVAKLQSNIAINQAADKAGEITRRGRIKAANVAAAALESGFSLSGSVRDVLGELTLATELDAQTAIYEGRIRSFGHLTKAAQERFQASYYNTASYLGAGAKLLSGAADPFRLRGASQTSDFSFA